MRAQGLHGSAHPCRSNTFRAKGAQAQCCVQASLETVGYADDHRTSFGCADAGALFAVEAQGPMIEGLIIPRSAVQVRLSTSRNH